MKPDIYLNQDLRQRIGTGLIRYHDKPCVVLDVSQDDNAVLLCSILEYTETGGLKTETVSVEDDFLDVSAPQLGYINYKNRALYLSRGPNRKYRQLTCPENITIYCPILDRDVSRDLNKNGVLYSHGVNDLFSNNYPHFKDAFESLNSHKVSSVAVNRDVAITVDSIRLMHVFVKDMKVGYIEPNQHKNTRVIVPEDEYGSLVSEFLSGVDWRTE